MPAEPSREPASIASKQIFGPFTATLLGSVVGFFVGAILWQDPEIQLPMQLFGTVMLVAVPLALGTHPAARLKPQEGEVWVQRLWFFPLTTRRVRLEDCAAIEVEWQRGMRGAPDSHEAFLVEHSRLRHRVGSFRREVEAQMAADRFGEALGLPKEAVDPAAEPRAPSGTERSEARTQPVEEDGPAAWRGLPEPATEGAGSVRLRLPAPGWRGGAARRAIALIAYCSFVLMTGAMLYSTVEADLPRRLLTLVGIILLVAMGLLVHQLRRAAIGAPEIELTERALKLALRLPGGRSVNRRRLERRRIHAVTVGEVGLDFAGLRASGLVIGAGSETVGVGAGLPRPMLESAAAWLRHRLAA